VKGQPCVSKSFVSSPFCSSSLQKLRRSRPHTPRKSIRAGKLIDADADRVRAKRMILVRGVKIETVGENLTVPAGATVINLSKMAVLPLKPGKYADISAVSGNCSMTSGCSKT
jgi:hypothetical protein